jgi:chloride channel protein, CIC family
MSTTPHLPESDLIPSSLLRRRALHFWWAVLLTGVSTGIGAAILTKLLEIVQRLAWHGSSTDILDGAQHASPWRHFQVLLGAALLTGAGQKLLEHLSSGNGIDMTEAIRFHAGRMPPLRTLGSAVLSVIIVGMGASLGTTRGFPGKPERYSRISFPTESACRMSSGGC